MLALRQHDLTVCMEQVHKPHNVSAVIRTADAVGIHEVHAVWPSQRMRTQLPHLPEATVGLKWSPIPPSAML